MTATILRVTGGQSYEFGSGTIIPAVSRGILGAFFPGIGTLTSGSTAALAKQAKNFYTGGAGTLTGTPAGSAGYSLFNSTAYLDTLLAEAQNLTFMAVVQGADTTANPQYIGNYQTTQSASALYSAWHTAPAATDYMLAVFNNGSGGMTNVSAALNVTTGTSWRLLVGRVTSGVSVELQNLTAGTVTITATALARYTTGTDTIRIGSSYSGSFAGANDVNQAWYYGVALTDTEVQTQAAQMRAYAAEYGITV